MIDNAKEIIEMWKDIMIDGTEMKPRGLQSRELEDYQLVINPNEPFMVFEDRPYDLNYFRKEMIWKLGANKYDRSIEEAASMWEKVRNDDGSFNSNYGQYWFGEQMGIWHAVMSLIRDRDTRQAVIPMLRPEHMQSTVRDTVCTECIGFRIRKGLLNMSVHMRSSDTVWGLGTDIPTFAFLYRLVKALVDDFTLSGKIIITAMSSHIYERHYGMVNRVIEKGVKGYKRIEMPWPTREDAMLIIASRGNKEMLSKAGELGRWLAYEDSSDKRS